MHLAAINGDSRIINLLLEQLDSEVKKVSSHQSFGNRSSENIRSYFLDMCGWEGNTPLHMAVKHGHLDIVRLLLEAGAQCDCGNDMGKTPWMLAQSLVREDIFLLFKDFLGALTFQHLPQNMQETLDQVRQLVVEMQEQLKPSFDQRLSDAKEKISSLLVNYGAIQNNLDVDIDQYIKDVPMTGQEIADLCAQYGYNWDITNGVLVE